jgi:hypothetical protein
VEIREERISAAKLWHQRSFAFVEFSMWRRQFGTQKKPSTAEMQSSKHFGEHGAVLSVQ